MKNSDCWFSSPTQIYWCCKALRDGRCINHRTEVREVRGWRLAAICERLCKQYGWPLITEYRGPENTAYYSLAPGMDLFKLSYPASAPLLADEAFR